MEFNTEAWRLGGAEVFVEERRGRGRGRIGEWKPSYKLFIAYLLLLDSGGSVRPLGRHNSPFPVFASAAMVSSASS